MERRQHRGHQAAPLRVAAGLAALAAGLAALALGACARGRPEAATYPYAATGDRAIESHIIAEGKDTPIRFHPDSDPRALELLLALRPQVLGPSIGTLADTRLAVTGVLLEGERRTAAGEPYREFVLQDWKLRAPFKEYARPDADPAAPAGAAAPAKEGEIILKSSLSQEDFTDLPELVDLDLSKFVEEAPGP